MKTVALYNLGCSKNFVDGENITGYMAANGFKPIKEYEDADVVIVNTCSFIEDATKEAIDTIFSMAKIGEGKKQTLVVSGCFSERYREEVAKEFPEVDLWVGVKDWVDDLSAFFSITEKEEFTRILSEPIHSQYIKISEGCSHNCAFCIIPSIRGGFKSRAEADIIKEAKWLESQGVKELIVVSQDTSFYGRDLKTDLADLLKTLLKETNFPWIRMMYLHPAFVDQKLLDLVASEERLCSYFDIPLQHISTSVLERMGRKPGRDGIYDLIKNIRATVPDATIRSSFILGFPGETEEDYEELCDFVRWAKLDKLGVFPYSPEDGTRAAEMAEEVPTDIAVERGGAVMQIQQDISRENSEDIVGTKVDVIIDRISDNPDFAFEARTLGDAPEVDGRVFIISGECSLGDIKKVEIIDCDDYDLFAKFVE
jgi:ribosomal protein S12 methylthiotransferase